MKEFRIEVPKGYVIDEENSTFECIKFKKKREIKTWGDLCEAGNVSDEVRISGYCLRVNNKRNRNVFATEKEAKSARAAAMISQLMPYYGGAIDESSWRDVGVNKFIIKRVCSSVEFSTTTTQYHFLAFKSYEQRDDFYDNNEQLVKDYLMIE